MFIHNLRLHRTLKLYQQIYNFNHLVAIITDSSWLDSLDTESAPKVSPIKQTEILLKEYTIANFYYETNDIWLKLISLSNKQFNHLIQQTILFLISQDKSLPLDSKKRVLLQNIFGLKSLEKIFLKDNTSIAITMPKLNSSLLNNEDFISNSGYEILKSVYETKHPAMLERINFRFKKHLQPEANLIDYWQQVTKKDKEAAITFVAKELFANFFLNEKK